MLRIFRIILSVVASILLVACSRPASPLEEDVSLQILHKGNAAEPADLDPQVTSGLPEFKILLALFEGLVNMDPKDLSPRPGVAASWSLSQNGLTYTFNLRPNARWSNGDPITAQDFIFSAQRILSKNLGAPNVQFFYDIVNAEAYHKGAITDFSKVGIRALDEHTLKIQLAKPLPYFINLLSHMSWYPVHKATILKYGQMNERGTGWTRPGNIVSNGPFKLKSWKLRESIVVERNPQYWDNATTQLEEIHFYPMENANSEEIAFRTGQLHITEAIPLPRVPFYREKKDSELHMAPFFSTYAYLFNTRKAPFNNQLVRQAISLALEREAITKHVTRKGELSAFRYTPPNILSYQTLAQCEENVQKARDLLTEAGYPNAKGFPKVTLAYNMSEAHREISEAIQYMLKKNLNIDIQLENQEWKVYLQNRKSSNFDMIRFGWAGDYLDPNAFLEIFTSEANNNYSGWENKRYDVLIAQASQTVDPQKRYALLDEAEQILIKELPVLPIYFYNTAYLVHKSVKGWYPNLLDLHPYQFVSLSKN